MYVPVWVVYLTAAGTALLLLLVLMWAAGEIKRLRRELAAERRRKSEIYNGAARATLKGQIAEQIAPLLPGFPFHPSDFRFLGQPVDFIVFSGLTDAKEGLGEIEEIVIGDIKQGSARLSPHQRMIKRAVEEGRVRWETIHIDKDFRLK